MSLTQEQQDLLNYDGEMTIEALAALDTYVKQCCNVSATSRKLHKSYVATKRLLRQPYVRELFKLKLMQKGVTPDKVAQVIQEGLEAMNGVYYEGNKVADEPNWAARQRFAQLAAEIYEVLKYQVKQDNNFNLNQVNIDNLNIDKLIAEAQRRGVPLPLPIARRISSEGK